MTTVNINNIVRVKLTEKGERVYKDAIGLYGIPGRIKGGVLETELWDIAAIFGCEFYMGADPMFENNEIILI